MGMAVLHSNFLWQFHIKSIFCRQVFRVQIIGNRLRVDIEETLKMLDSLAEGGQRLQVLQVANVMADKSLPSLAQAKGVLKMTAAGQQWHGEIERQGDR